MSTGVFQMLFAGSTVQEPIVDCACAVVAAMSPATTSSGTVLDETNWPPDVHADS